VVGKELVMEHEENNRIFREAEGGSDKQEELREEGAGGS